MSSTITIFEHEPKRAADHGLAERHLRLVDRVNRAVGTEVLRASYRDGGTLTACQHVGVIRLGNRTIQVLPKIYRTPVREGEDPSEPQVREATSNLLHMLEIAGQLPVREHELSRRRETWPPIPLVEDGKDILHP